LKLKFDKDDLERYKILRDDGRQSDLKKKELKRSEESAASSNSIVGQDLSDALVSANITVIGITINETLEKVFFNLDSELKQGLFCS
jgi:hypothetical protein